MAPHAVVREQSRVPLRQPFQELAMEERTNIGAARRALGVSLAWAVTLSLCHPTASRAQTHEPERRVVVRGRVVDDVTHLGIPDAFVSIATNTTILAGGVADSAGYFQLQVAPRGSLSINVRRLGYQPTSECRWHASDSLRPAPYVVIRKARCLRFVVCSKSSAISSRERICGRRCGTRGRGSLNRASGCLSVMR